jgi:hypothetical protein
MIRWSLALAFSLLIIGACLAQVPDCSVVPGWTGQGAKRTYNAENLFEYIDGNAEGYLVYDFVKMNGVSCKSGAVTFDLDVSEMARPESAYGLYLALRDPRLPFDKIGTGGQIQPRRGMFVKDKYFVDIAANPEGDHSAQLRAFLTAMEKRIQGQTAAPQTLGWFPPEKLDASALRMVPQSVLGLGILKSGYVAQYPYGKAFIVTEATPASAQEVMKKAAARFGQTQPAQIADGAFQATDKYLGRLCFFRKGRYIAGFANVAATADPVAASKALAARIP